MNDTRTFVSEDADTIDVGKYVGAIARQWKVVVAVVVLIVVVAAVATAVLARTSPRYQSEAAVSLSGSTYELNFDPKFKTIDALASASAALAARADEFKTIALGREVREAATQSLAGKVPAAQAQGASVDAKVQGTLVKVTAVASDPETAQRLADAYAIAARDRFNTVYGQSEQNRNAIEKERADSEAAYRDALAKLTAFTEKNQIDELNRQISQREAMRQDLVDQETGMIKGRIDSYYAVVAGIDRLKLDAQALRQQIADTGNSSASLANHALSLMSLQTRLINLGAPAGESRVEVNKDGKYSFTTTGSGQTQQLPQFQMNVDTLLNGSSQQSLLRDTDVLIETIDQRREQFRRDFQETMAELSQQVAKGNPTLTTPGYQPVQRSVAEMIAVLNDEINTLRARLREETVQRDLLTQNADNAKTLWTTLTTKSQEAAVASSANSGRAIVAAGATDAVSVFPGPLSRTLPLAIGLGLVIGAILAIVLDRRRGQPRQPEPSAPARMPLPVGK